MYGALFCRLYNEFGWNEYPRVFAEQLMQWLDAKDIAIDLALDLGCGTGVLCGMLYERGIEARGIDLSASMIAIARAQYPGPRFEVGDMTRFAADKPVDLVTCTGDALNHLFDLTDVRRCFDSAFAALAPGGLFIFDLLDASEVPLGEPFDADSEDHLRVRFQAEMDDRGVVHLNIRAFDGDALKLEENIVEKLHPLPDILAALRSAGFKVVQCDDRLDLDSAGHGTTWIVVARKPYTFSTSGLPTAASAACS